VIKHIEDMKCPVLSLPERPPDYANYDFPTAGINLTMGAALPGPQPSQDADSSEDSDADGGVPLHPTFDNIKDKGLFREAEVKPFPLDEWPQLGAPGTPKREKSRSISTQSAGGLGLEGYRDTTVRHVSPFSLAHGLVGESCKGKHGSTPNVPWAGTGILSHGGPSHHLDTVHSNMHGTNPDQFWNPDKGRFCCDCGASFMYVTTFQYHLTMDDEKINE
jgi:hypothetical protein